MLSQKYKNELMELPFDTSSRCYRIFIGAKTCNYVDYTSGVVPRMLIHNNNIHVLDNVIMSGAFLFKQACN